MGRFDSRAFVVTGGASGIGEATCRALVAEGGRVVIADLQADRAKALAAELGDAALAQATDVTRESDIAAAVGRAVSDFGQLDGMVNNAGIIGAIGSLRQTSVDAFDHTMAILSRAVFLGMKHAGQVMCDQRHGSIVSLASTAGLMGALGPHVYTMAKHGVVGLTKSAASEFSAYGVRVNAVAPAGTVTPMTSALVDNDTDAITAAIAEANPLGLPCLAQDIANGILFLLSDEARQVNGHTLVIDGGITSGGKAPPFYSQDPELLLHAGQRGPAS